MRMAAVPYLIALMLFVVSSLGVPLLPHNDSFGLALVALGLFLERTCWGEKP